MVYLEINVLGLGVSDSRTNLSARQLRALSIMLRLTPRKMFTYSHTGVLPEGTLVEVPFGTETRYGVVVGEADVDEVQQLAEQSVQIKMVERVRPDLAEQLSTVGDLA